MKIEQLQAARIKTGKSQAQAAAELGMSKQMYQKYEYGMSAQAIQTAIRIAKAFDATVEDLWGANALYQAGDSKAND